MSGQELGKMTIYSVQHYALSLSLSPGIALHTLIPLSQMSSFGTAMLATDASKGTLYVLPTVTPATEYM